MQARLGTIICKFAGDPAIRLREEAIFVKSHKCRYHVTFDVDLDLEHTLDAGPLGTIVCKFGDDPAIFLVEEAICAKCLWTDGRRTIAYIFSPFHELKI